MAILSIARIFHRFSFPFFKIDAILNRNYFSKDLVGGYETFPTPAVTKLNKSQSIGIGIGRLHMALDWSKVDKRFLLLFSQFFFMC